MVLVQLKHKSGSVFLILLLLLAIAGFFLVRAITVKSFSDAQAEVEENFQDRYNPDSSRYTLSKKMGSPSSWKTYENTKYAYQFKYPVVWPVKQTALEGGQLDKFQAALGNKVNLTVTAQNTYSLPQKVEKIKSNGIEFMVVQNDKSTKTAVATKGKLYYIIRLSQEGYFSGESEFKGIFYNVLKNFKFLN